MNPLRWVLLAAAGLALAAILALGFRLERSKTETAQVRAELASAQEAATAAALRREGEYRAIETQREAAQKAILENAKRETDSARADAVAADAAADGLRAQIARYSAAARRAAQDSGTPAGGPAAGDPIGVFADLLARADKRAGIVEGYADRAAIAGRACERAYDSLAVTPAQ